MSPVPALTAGSLRAAFDARVLYLPSSLLDRLHSTICCLHSSHGVRLLLVSQQVMLPSSPSFACIAGWYGFVTHFAESVRCFYQLRGIEKHIHSQEGCWILIHRKDPR